MSTQHNVTQKAQRHWKTGTQHAKAGQWSAASKAFDLALKLAPHESLYALNLARALLRQGRIREAGDAAEKAFRADPAQVVACALWAHCLTEQKRHAEVVTALRALPPEAPRGHDWHESLGRALQYSGKPKEAIAAYFDALALKIDLPQVHYQMGTCFNELDMKEEAAQCFHTALALGIGRHELGVRGLLSYFEREVCRWQSAQADLVALLAALHALPDGAAAPTTPFAHVTLFDDPVDQLRAARAASRQSTIDVQALPALPARTPAERQGRLRVGYVSADFHQHATCILMAEMLEHHDRERFEVTLYSHGKDDGSLMRKRIEGAAEHFVNLRGVSDRDAAQRIRDDRVDLLIDLKGYTKDNRLSLFAWKPARVSASFLGFPGSTGADFIDYIVGDPVVTPLEHAAHFDEKIAQMPVCYQPNDRQRALPTPPTRSEAGLPDDGQGGPLVLCGFNQPFKISAPVFDTWCRLLHRLPQAVLWLLEWNGQVRKNIELEAAKRGIAPERLAWAPRRHPKHHMARLQLADIFIDTWPCNAHTTASDALWAAVPVVTFAGRTFASRVAASLNHAVGLDGLICDDVAHYEERIVALAHDRPQRERLREHLAQARSGSALFDSLRFTRDIEALYLRMLDRHDQGLPAAHLPAA
ncbi:putative O-linked N-acetylglucosamine transferase, SPINDLY family [Burkholderiales bacterium JOSHI_001]|nr:putative O-linked N-acetylglucosamine transferase, SPINDLY family [Burkholderiales bacterium JOSHI_001]